MLTPESCCKAPSLKAHGCQRCVKEYLKIHLMHSNCLVLEYGFHDTRCMCAQYWSHMCIAHCTLCKYHVWVQLHCVVLWLNRIVTLCTVIKWQVNHLRSYSPLQSFISRIMSWILSLLDDNDGDGDSDLNWIPNMMMIMVFFLSVILVMILCVIIFVIMIFRIRMRTRRCWWLQCGQT